ncbi:MAG: phosphoribosyl-ATP diphosphatase [Minwuia sp.]|uniref:phosphoribosyl-ATP diphosphatase n=1 Tax=Minwuia sp. TaxID=2493630 RepID=UPI003A88E1A1
MPDYAILQRLYDLAVERKSADPSTSYVAGLHAKGEKKIAQKVGEEGLETAMAAVSEPREAIVAESADLLFHLLVLWAHKGIDPADVMQALEAREGTSGLTEKAARKSRPDPERVSLRAAHLLVLPFFAAALFILLYPGLGMPPEAAAGGALAIAVVGMWATGVLPEHMTSLVFFLTAMVFGVATAPAVFSGFSAGAFWLLFGGMILGTAVGKTGLGARLARYLAIRIGVSYTGVIVGIVAVALVLSFVMPSATGRAVLLMPVAISLAEAFRFEPGSNGRLGITVVAAMSAVIPGFGILPANVPNLVMAGAADTIYGLTLNYASFLLLHFPILGILKAICIVVIVRVLFPDRLPEGSDPEAPPARLTGPEKRLAFILVMALTLWATDVLHGVSPAWVSLFAGILCLLPPFSLIESEKISEAVQLKPLIFIAGVLSLGAVVVSSGFADQLAGAFLAVAGLAPGDDFGNFATIVGASVMTSVLGTAPTVPAVWTPLAGGLAEATGWRLETVVMIQVLAFSSVILPYQVPPLVVALQLGKVPMAAGIKAVLALAAVTLFVLLPLDYLWWGMLGMFDG